MQHFLFLIKKWLFSYLTIGIFSLLVILFASVWFMNEQAANKPGGDYQVKPWVQSMNRAQMAYFLENERFADSIEALEILPNDTATRLKMHKTVSLLVVMANNRTVFHYGIPESPYLKAYVGAIFLNQSTPVSKIKNDGDLLSRSTILCRSKLPGTKTIADPIDAKRCGLGTEKVNR